MFQVVIKGKTMAEMRDNALEIMKIFADANVEGLKEKKTAKPEAKSALSKKELDAAKALSERAELERQEKLNAQATQKLIDEATAPVEEQKVEAPKKVTKDDVISEMQKLIEAKNVKASREVLTKFGLNRLSDADEKLYPSLIEALQKAAQ